MSRTIRFRAFVFRGELLHGRLQEMIVQTKSGRAPPVPTRPRPDRYCDSVQSDGLFPHDFALPVLVENRPEDLVEVLAVAEKRLSQDAFLNRAHLLERAVSAAVAQGSARFEAVDSHRIEREGDHELRAFLEHRRSPVPPTHRESPFSSA